MRTERSRRLPRIRLSALTIHFALAVGAIAMFAPFVWMVLTGFKTLPQILKEPLSFIPHPWTTQNFTDAWTQAPFVQAYANSAYITIAIVCGSLITTSMAGYAFARIEFPGSRWLFGVILVSQMIPKQVTLIPFYLLMAKIGWVDSHLSLMIPGILVNPFGVFLARQFILSIPKELEEAATVDGASRLRIYWQIILPLIRPGLGALAIIVALDAWNNFLLPLVLLNRSQLFTVPLLLSQFQGQFGGINTGLIMAATAVSTIPMLIAFIIGQKQIMSSLASSGLGGR